MRIHFNDPTMMEPPTTDIAFVQLFQCNTDADDDAGTLVTEIPFVALQGYVDYPTPVEGKYYRIKFKDTAGNVSAYPSRAVLFTTVPDPVCLVFDTLVDTQNRPMGNMEVKVVLNSPNATYQGKSIGSNVVTTMTDGEGNWDLQLIPNALIKPAGTKYTFYFPGNRVLERVVPNDQMERFSDLKSS